MSLRSRELADRPRLETQAWPPSRKDGESAAFMPPGWSSLSEESRDKDRNAIRTLPAILRAAGFLILRLPPP